MPSTRVLQRFADEEEKHAAIQKRLPVGSIVSWKLSNSSKLLSRHRTVHWPEMQAIVTER